MSYSIVFDYSIITTKLDGESEIVKTLDNGQCVNFYVDKNIKTKRRKNYV